MIVIDSAKPNRDLALLYPPFRERLERGLAIAHSRGLMAYPFECFRNPARQAWLYAQGRTRPGMIVTRAKPGNSWHEYGVATDLVFDGSAQPGTQWDWDGDYIGEKKGDYQKLGPIMQAQGLEWFGAVGSDFFEMPHFQQTWGLSLERAQLLMASGGIHAVWRELDRLLL